MEVDNLLILILSLLAYRWDRAGAWILLAGVMRYLFVAAARLMPWLSAELYPSQRRRIVCVVQTVALIACLMPVWPQPLAMAIACGKRLRKRQRD